VGVNEVLVVGEVLQEVHELLAVLNVHLVLGQPVIELGLVVGTIMDIASKSNGSQSRHDSSAEGHSLTQKEGVEPN
jgi:hypothetical protein